MNANANKRGFVISLRARLFIGFMALSLPLLLLIVFLIPKVHTIVYLNQKIGNESLPQILDSQILQTQDTLEEWVITGDIKNREHFQHLWDEINSARILWDTTIHALDNTALRKEWDRLQELYVALYNAQSAIINAPRAASSTSSIEDIRPTTQVFIKEMIAILDGVYSTEKGKRVGGIFNILASGVEHSTNIISLDLIALEHFAYGLLIFAVLLTLIVPYFTHRAISIPVEEAINIAEQIAAGERHIEINIQSQDQLGKLLSSLKVMQEAIRKNEKSLRIKEEESRDLFEKLVNSSKKFREHSSKVAAGDLRERLKIDEQDVLQDLGNDLNLMTDGLASITKKITKISNDIVAMVETVFSSANEQSESIISQASAINEISASLEEIDQSSKQTMAKAQALREVAKNTYEQGKLGTESVEQSILGIKASEEKMKLIAQTILDLSNHTQQIGDITSVVNTLAQQSKMLALNASIEASKAGEAGRGFAAVATEVRNLAEQSEQSTVQVQKILEDIRRTTEKAVTVTVEGEKTLDSGLKLIEKAGQVIQALSKMINDASISSQHIEASIRQEAVGIEQIVEGMNEINRTTALFSGSIKEFMRFINELDEIAKHLKEDMNLYKV
ncbi:methyl-accepting chemotaxis protein [Legionella saoudiensis]|uniref:methyl-accepting chemotaxis protein n=1 Tax=Legionella saoudiensis TaxID=1750561 RepID=UPI000731CE03|nr:methyl-accepting chemotaxis protein [Legionella saoudiensis]